MIGRVQRQHFAIGLGRLVETAGLLVPQCGVVGARERLLVKDVHVPAMSMRMYTLGMSRCRPCDQSAPRR